MFLAAFPLPIVSASRWQSPCSIPSHILPSGSAVPHLHPHLPPARSQKPQPCLSCGWLFLPSFVPHTSRGADPWHWQGYTHSLPSPTQHLLVHNPRVVPAPSQTLSSLHVSLFPLLWLYPAGNLSPWWFTKLHSFTSWVPETLAQRDLGCCPGARWAGGSGDAVGQGCWREGPERGASGCALLSVLRLSVPPRHLWEGVCLWHSLLAVPHQHLPWCQCPTKAGWEPSLGRRWPKLLPQISTRAGPRQATASHSHTHSHSALV